MKMRGLILNSETATLRATMNTKLFAVTVAALAVAWMGAKFAGHYYFNYLIAPESYYQMYALGIFTTLGIVVLIFGTVFYLAREEFFQPERGYLRTKAFVCTAVVAGVLFTACDQP